MSTGLVVRFCVTFVVLLLYPEVGRGSRVEHGSAYACAPLGENVFICDAALVHEDMKTSQGDVDALHRYPLSCSVLYY